LDKVEILKLITHYSSLITHCSLLTVLSLYILVGTPLVPFHGDEATILFASRDYDYWFVQGDINRMLYADPPVSAVEQDIRLRNGMVSKLLAGVAWHAAGYTLADLNETWDWGADYAYNVQNGHMPPEGLLQAARWSSSAFLAAGVVVVFALGWLLGKMPVAYLASLYYALNPVLLLNGRRMMMEGSVTLFCLLVVLVGIGFLRSLSHEDKLTAKLPRLNYAAGFRAIALGIVSGLALCSKQIAAFVLLGVYGACLVCLMMSFIGKRHTLPLRQRWLAVGKGIVGLALATIVTAGVFVALNPVWWNDPLGRTLMALQDRQNLLNVQVRAFGSYNGDALGGFWRQVFIALPQYYEVPVWQDYIGAEIARYESSLLQGVSIGGSTIGGVLVLVLLLIGMWALMRSQCIDDPLRCVIIGWTLAVVLAALLLTPFEWQRYYLLVYPPIGVLGALGFTAGIRRISNLALRTGNRQL
jgi:4-amino-4-deoxy-L-arabinose transferase-like glycosyltransferase